MIDWDEKSKTGTMLTSALLICKQSPSLDDWKSANQYASNAKVSLHRKLAHLILLLSLI